MAKREPVRTWIEKDVIVEASVLAAIVGVSTRTLLRYAEQYGWRMVKVGGKTLIDTGSIFA